MIATAPRECGLLDVLAAHTIATFADTGYQGAGGTVRHRSSATPSVRTCRPRRATALVAAILVLHLIETGRYSR